jgi:predicted XRE-type DNA-binding protein
VDKKYQRLLDKGWELGSSNTFADLGIKNAGKHQAKAYLRAAILSRIAVLDITQLEAARRIGVPQPKMSNLMTDQSPLGFSSDKLMEFATKLGLDVEIKVRPSRSGNGKVIVAGLARRNDARTPRLSRRKAKAA